MLIKITTYFDNKGMMLYRITECYVLGVMVYKRTIQVR